MSANYKGHGCVSRHMAALNDSTMYIKVKVKPQNVHFFTKVMEAYTHVVFIVPINTGEGVVGLFATPDNMPLLREILSHFPGELEIME